MDGGSPGKTAASRYLTLTGRRGKPFYHLRILSVSIQGFLLPQFTYTRMKMMLGALTFIVRQTVSTGKILVNLRQEASRNSCSPGGSESSSYLSRLME